MNVKQVLFFFAIVCASTLGNEVDGEAEGLHIEIPFGNPYKAELDIIYEELVEVYNVVRVCIDHFLMDVPLATGTEIEVNCAGTHFSIIDHIFLLKMKKSMELYNKSLIERFEEAFSKYPDEIAYFMSLYKMFLEKGFHNIYDTMQLAKRGSRYYVQEDIYDSLLELSKDMLNIIGEFSSLLVKEKNKIRDFIKEKLIERDENLKILLRLDRGGVDESEAHSEVLAESSNQSFSLAERIHQMDQQVKHDTEAIQSGAAMKDDQTDMTGEAGSNKFTAFADSIMPLKGDDKAEVQLMAEFSPEAIGKNFKDDEDNIKIDERAEVPEASEPTFKDELDFYYERDNH